LENTISLSDQISQYFSEVALWPFVLLGLVILFALGVELLNRRRRVDAVDYYDTTFKTELAGLYPHPTDWPEDLALHLRASFPLMRDAFENLRSFIPQDQLHDYNLAWNKFYDFCRMNGEINENQAGTTTSPIEAEYDPKQAFHQLVSDLLAYTEQFKR
jgi:hypothetical protein